MFLLNRRHLLGAGGAAVGLSALGGRFAHAAPVERVTFTASPMGAAVDSVIVVGEQSALVIDAQFIRADAEALVAEIEATGRDLETIFVTHYHPDHHFGGAVLKARWPEAKIVAHPAVAAKLGEMGQAMFDGRKAVFGDALADTWAAPEALSGPLTLEGERFEVLDPMQGDTSVITPVALPQFGAVVASDIVFNGTHMWMAEALDGATLDAWRKSLDAIEGLGLAEIIPGHRAADTVNDASGVAHTRAYLSAWEAVLAAGHKTADAMRADLIEKAGDYEISPFFVDMAIKAALGGEG